MPDTNRKRSALAKYLGEDPDTVTIAGLYFEVNSQIYLVLTDKEADERALASAREDLWAFNSDFWAGYTSLPQVAIRALAKAQGVLCEDFGPVLEGLLGARLTEMLADAIQTDGRGHFLAAHDGEEIAVTDKGTLYIYRVT